MKGKILCLLLLLLATTANLSSHLLTDDNLLTTWLEQISKPLLIPSLIGYLWFSIPNRSQQSFLLLVLALFFAWIGDILLLGGEQEFLFLSGLAAFLVMQFLYIFLFRKSWPRISLLYKQPYWTLPFILVGISFYTLALPNLWHDQLLTVAVFIYTTALISMTLAALNRSYKIKGAFWSIFLGAFLFLNSDFLIGINAFIEPQFPYANLAIMATYILGQFLIVQGHIQLLSMQKNDLSNSEIVSNN